MLHGFCRIRMKLHVSRSWHCPSCIRLLPTSSYIFWRNTSLRMHSGYHLSMCFWETMTYHSIPRPLLPWKGHEHNPGASRVCPAPQHVLCASITPQGQEGTSPIPADTAISPDPQGSTPLQILTMVKSMSHQEKPLTRCCDYSRSFPVQDISGEIRGRNSELRIFPKRGSFKIQSVWDNKTKIWVEHSDPNEYTSKQERRSLFKKIISIKIKTSYVWLKCVFSTSAHVHISVLVLDPYTLPLEWSLEFSKSFIQLNGKGRDFYPSNRRGEKMRLKMQLKS